MKMNNVGKNCMKYVVKPVAKFAYKHRKKIGGVGLVFSFFELNKKTCNKAYNKGFVAASKIYELKFEAQTEQFLSKEKSMQNNLCEYKKLVAEYEKEICKLEKKLNKSETEKEYLLLLIEKKNSLLALEKCS